MKQSILVLQGKDILSISISKEGKSRYFQVKRSYFLVLLFSFSLLVIFFLAIAGLNLGFLLNVSLESFLKNEIKATISRHEMKSETIKVDASRDKIETAPFVNNFSFVEGPDAPPTTEENLISIVETKYNILENQLHFQAYIENVSNPHRLLRGRFVALLWNNKTTYVSPAALNFHQGTFFKWQKLPTFSFNKLRPVELVFTDLPANVNPENYILSLLFFDDDKTFLTKSNYTFGKNADK